jgi:hypothetical protein
LATGFRRVAKQHRLRVKRQVWQHFDGALGANGEAVVRKFDGQFPDRIAKAVVPLAARAGLGSDRDLMAQAALPMAIARRQMQHLARQ